MLLSPHLVDQFHVRYSFCESDAKSKPCGENNFEEPSQREKSRKDQICGKNPVTPYISKHRREADELRKQASYPQVRLKEVAMQVLRFVTCRNGKKWRGVLTGRKLENALHSHV